MKLKSRTLFIYFIAAGFGTIGCSGPKQYISKRPVNDVKSVLIIGPFADIRTIHTGDRMQFDYEMSSEVYKEMKGQIPALVPDGVKINTITADSVSQKLLLTAAEKIVEEITSRKVAAKQVVVPQVLLNMLDSVGQNFGFFIMQAGFSRTQNNYINHLYYNRAAVNVLTLGNVTYIPYRDGSTMIGFIIDRKNGNLAYYKKIFWQQRDPTEKIVIKGQLHDLMMSYFQHSK